VIRVSSGSSWGKTAINEHSPASVENTGDMLDVYRLAVRLRTVSVSDVARALGWADERALVTVEKLQRAELVRPMPGNEEMFIAVSPETAESRLLAPLESLITDAEQRVENLRVTLAGFHLVHDEASLRRTGTEVRLLSDPELISAALARAAERCGFEVVSACPGGSKSSQTFDPIQSQANSLLLRGVNIRQLYQHTARFCGATRKHAEFLSGHGGEVRSLGETFERLIVFDREIAFLFPREDSLPAVEIRHGALLEFVTAVFDRLWSAGRHFSGTNRTADVSQVVNEIRIAIARQLAQGETDEVIARRMGMSVRTCRGHIAKIYEEFGARSRCHLGVLITRSGLLEMDLAT
jgi:DNA-binding CsgD family transcriptional regulator/sugar-specific transcriptional regulator TrmB